MRIYLSLPISGYDIEERKAYAAKQVEMLRAIFTEYDIYNPLSIVGDMHHSYAYYMGKDIAELSASDIVVFCPGFNRSQGCMTEFYFAQDYGITILIIDSDGGVKHCDLEYIQNVKDESEKKEPEMVLTQEQLKEQFNRFDKIMSDLSHVEIKRPVMKDGMLTYKTEREKELEKELEFYHKDGYWPCRPIETKRGTFTCTNDIQNCINVYEERIDELTNQCNELSEIINTKDDIINASAALEEQEQRLINEIRLGRFKIITIKKIPENGWAWTASRSVKRNDP